MRLMVLFDLPVVTKDERRAYAQFRRFLLNDGYDMIQFSVYGRILNGTDAEEKHMKRLLNSLPPEGSIRVLTVTEKQYASMKILVGLPISHKKLHTPPTTWFFSKPILKKKPRPTPRLARVPAGRECSYPG